MLWIKPHNCSYYINLYQATELCVGFDRDDMISHELRPRRYRIKATMPGDRIYTLSIINQPGDEGRVAAEAKLERIVSRLNNGAGHLEDLNWRA